MNPENASEKKLIPIREGIFTEPFLPLENIRLIGSKCRQCGAVQLGRTIGCVNCAGNDLEEINLSKRGKVYTYSVAQYPPPAPYKPADPYIPFPVAWVELPEGLRITSTLVECDVDKVDIGMEVELVVSAQYIDEEGNEVISYKFRPV